MVHDHTKALLSPLKVSVGRCRCGGGGISHLCFEIYEKSPILDVAVLFTQRRFAAHRCDPAAKKKARARYQGVQNAAVLYSVCSAHTAVGNVCCLSFDPLSAGVPRLSRLLDNLRFLLRSPAPSFHPPQHRCRTGALLLQCERSSVIAAGVGKRKDTMATMPGPSLGAGEEVLVTAHATHKKTPGTAWFTTRRALWRAADGRAAVQRAEVPWATVKSFQVRAVHSSSSFLCCS